ncbi:hypothetical protein STEG23_005564, partial [Scotinomys teguina]
MPFSQRWDLGHQPTCNQTCSSWGPHTGRLPSAVHAPRILCQKTTTQIRYAPCVPDLSKTFIIKGYGILSQAFSASNDMIMGVIGLFKLFI